MTVLEVENASKLVSSALIAIFENEIQKASQSFKFRTEDQTKEYARKSRDNENIDPASQPEKGNQKAARIAITMKLQKGKIVKKTNSERVEYILSAYAKDIEDGTQDWSSNLFSQKKAVILKKKRVRKVT